MKIVAIATAIAVSVVSCNVWAATSDQDSAAQKKIVVNKVFSPQQKAAIEEITRDYLIQHPDVLVAAARALQEKQAQQVQQQAQTAIVKNKEQLFNNSIAPTGGNPDGKVILVEFFDYQCGHCKAMQPIMEKLFTADSNVKVIYSELPIFGENSEYAAKAALAAAKQGKFKEFHNALFTTQDGLTAENVKKIAKSLGLNVTQLEQDMKDPAIEKQIKDNFSLAQQLRLEGTPSFVFANKALTQFDFIPGATTQQDMQQRINKLAGVK